MFYMARDGDNFMKMQLHRVGLDGKGDVRLTDPKFNHSSRCAGAGGGGGAAAPAWQRCGISPDNKFFVDVYQTHDQPPATQVVDVTGKVVAQVAKSDMTKFEKLGLKKVEMFTYLAADGKTTLYGTICVSVELRSGEEVSGARVGLRRARVSAVTNENFATPSATTEYGFLMRAAQFAVGAGPGQGDARSGLHEARHHRDGRHGRGHQGAVVAAVLRQGRASASTARRTAATARRCRCCSHPDVWAAASASSPVTSWYHYDSIYTERYMWIPQENKEGYEAGNAMNYAKNLQGPAAHLLRHRGQQRAPEQLDAADSRAAAGRQELRGAGRPRRRATPASTTSG